MQRICLSVKFRVSENPQNERTATNYIVEENDKYVFDLSELTKKPFTNNNSNVIALCNAEARY